MRASRPTRTRAIAHAMNPTLVIRPPTRDDYADWKPLWDGYNAFYEREGPTALPDAITQATWQRFFDAYEPVHALVAEHEGRLVGLTHYLFHRSTTRIEPTCYLQDLFTLPSLRGQGVGRQLIEGVYERARQAGVKRVYWQTHETNLAGQRLYDKVADRTGFIIFAKNV
jgi:GNAT superfamily N-acetyltransferase